MGYRQWKKRDPGSQRNDPGWPTRTQRHGLPPASPGLSSDTVPNWEKKFCSQMPWKDFCDKKRVVHLFPKVLNWDDSAGKEAFDNAKARYWAEMNGLPCEIPLVDPDMYIDEVDHDTSIDPLLLEDLYKKLPPPPCQDIPDLDSIRITPTGWDVVDPSPADNIPEFILANSSTANDIVYSSAPIREIEGGDGDNLNSKINITSESIKIIPTGWGDEEDSESINARDMQGRRSNGAFTEEDQSRDWQKERRNDNMGGSETFSSWEHQEHKNASNEKRHRRRRRGGGSIGSNHVNLTCQEQDYQMDRWSKYADEQYLGCHEQGYQMDRWTKYADEQNFWHHKPSLDRGLSCAPENH